MIFRWHFLKILISRKHCKLHLKLKIKIADLSFLPYDFFLCKQTSLLIMVLYCTQIHDPIICYLIDYEDLCSAEDEDDKNYQESISEDEEKKPRTNLSLKSKFIKIVHILNRRAKKKMEF